MHKELSSYRPVSITYTQATIQCQVVLSRLLLISLYQTKLSVSLSPFCQLRQELLQPSQPTTDPPPHFFRSQRSSTLDFHFLSNYSYIKAIMLYKGNHWTRCAGFMDASWVRLGITNDDLGTSWALHGDNLGMTWGYIWHYFGKTWQDSGILLLTPAYSGILWHTLAYS